MSHTENRRQFLSRSLSGAAVLGSASALGYWYTKQQPDSSVTSTDIHTPQVIVTHAKRARKIAIGTDDQILVAADKNILRYSSTGQPLNAVSLKRPARCLAADDNGNLLVGVLDHVEVYNAAGELVQQWDAPRSGSIIGGITTTSSHVFVADAGLKVIWKYDNSGKLLDQFGKPGQFVAPAEFFAITSSENEYLHVANPGRHRVETFSTHGKLVSQWGTKSRALAGFSGCCNPVGLTRLSDGQFITAERGQPSIKLFTEQGQFASQILGPNAFVKNAAASQADNGAGCQSGGLDIAVNSHDTLLILDRVTGLIHIREQV